MEKHLDNNCCTSTNETSSDSRMSVVCSDCGSNGKKVSTQTIKACLSISLEAVDDEETYFFCRSKDCLVVYFGDKGSVFKEDDLREPVHQKHPNEDGVFVCYCYQHTPASIRAELLEHGKTDVVERVTSGTKAGSCACEIRNPQGSCCLGNVRALVKRIEQELSSPSSKP